MARLLREHGIRTEDQQARYFAARERRKSLGAVLDLHQTHRFGIPTAVVPATAFPDRDVIYTFRTTVRILDNSGQHRGLIFELGDATTAIAAWVDDDQVGFRAGDTGADRALASYTTGTGELPVGRLLRLIFAVRPNDGRVRVWDDGVELARDEASGGSLPNGWAAASNGAFAAAATGALPADVVRTGAPAGFEVVSPLLAYAKQVPRHFV